MLVTQAFRFELDPPNKVRSALASHAGAAQFAYNWGLDQMQARLDARRVLAALARRRAIDGSMKRLMMFRQRRRAMNDRRGCGAGAPGRGPGAA